MKKESKIFVAGGTGMVGRAILNNLVASGYRNIVSNYHSRKPDFKSRDVNRFVHMDLKRQADANSFFENEKPEYVFLAAAKVGGILANSTYKAEFIYDNTMIAVNVIHAAHKNGAKKLLNLGSSCIYPKLSPQPMKENYLLTGELEPTNEPYAIAKIAAIKLCRYYNEQYETNFISAMPTNLYGPGDNFNLETSHVLPALIRKFYLAKLLRRAEGRDDDNYKEIAQDLKRFPFGFNFSLDDVSKRNLKHNLKLILEQVGITVKYVTLWGSGEAGREFLYVDDLADACVFLMENFEYKDIGEFVNIGSGRDIKIKDLAELIKEIVGYKGEIRHDLSKPDGTPWKLLDVSRVESLGWRPKIYLREGIKKTIEWYTNFGPNGIGKFQNSKVNYLL